MSVTPQLSVLLPCRDAEDTLDEALRSLVAQTFGDFEIIAVDDGSTDRTPNVLREWARRDQRVHVMETQPRGIVSALDIAAKHANGSLLARMDADDIADNRRLELQVAYLRANPNVAACGTLVRYFPREIVRDGARRYEHWINSVVSPDDIERDLFVECPIPHPSLAIRRAAYRRVGGYRDHGWPEDYDLVLRLWQNGYRLGKVPEQLLRWRESSVRLSRVDSRYDESAFRRCKVHYLDTRISGRDVVVCGAGPVGKAFAVALQRSGHNVAAFIDVDPRKIGQSVHGAPVRHPGAIEDYRNCYLLAAVGSSKGRAELRAVWKESGFTEPDQCCAVA